MHYRHCHRCVKGKNYRYRIKNRLNSVISLLLDCLIVQIYKFSEAEGRKGNLNFTSSKSDECIYAVADAV